MTQPTTPTSEPFVDRRNYDAPGTAPGVERRQFANCHEGLSPDAREIAEAIDEYNKDEPARLAALIFSQADIYVGIRSLREYQAARSMADLSIWVERPHFPAEKTCDIRSTHCDIIVRNDGTLEELKAKAERLAKWTMQNA